MATITRFEDLECWQLARELSKMVYDITKHGELAKDFSIKNQIRSSSGSVMDNLAEGFDRGGNKEFSQFLSIARGSCGEVRSQLYRSLDQNYIAQVKFEEIYKQAERTGKSITGLMNYLANSEFKGNKFKRN